MNITLSQQQAFILAERFAAEVHGALIGRHLRRLGYAEDYRYTDDSFRHMRAAIASIPHDGQFGERREFIIAIKYCFKQLRKEKGTEPRWQNYVRSVAKFNGLPCPGAPDDPGLATFVLRERRAA